MSTNRNDILSQLKSLAQSVEGMHPERVRIGPVAINAAMLPTVHILPQREIGTWADGSQVHRRLEVFIGVFAQVDLASVDSQFQQADQIYGLVHDAVEDAVLDGLGGLCDKVEESPEGVIWDGLEDSDNVVYIGSVWICEYTRTLAVNSATENGD